ncbi:TIGR04282 family arsenosugar biosynthesis glycosyltransferase [Embleya sp. MST-111070]|uniref:TIGR04282 family arsenosugar biosynthesis glycosyltransferase n=1 Tax=Embleya sp. MST-111070 TaxID=3398231 RepID=UPI003F741842
MTTLLVIAKAPVPGRVKTRLTPPLTPDQAAAVAEAALADTLAAVLATPARRRVLVLAGAPGPWLPPGFEVCPQHGGGLDLRLAAAFAGCTGPTLLVGMDTPQITPDLLSVDWSAADAWFGPATDGGFWAIGMRRPDPSVFPGVPMSVPETGAVQRARLLAAGLTVRDLPTLTDIDTADDLAAVTRDIPGTHCAGVARALLGDGVYA